MLTDEAIARLEEARILWMATVRPDGRPHLVPVWFVFADGRLYCCIEPTSVKARNLLASPQASVALEEGKHPIIGEGRAEFLIKPWPVAVVEAFTSKYEWDIATDEQYTALIQITPVKWMMW
ncbi:MAG: pyridoxamine 5'-phosphate oxidase [Acidobacteria bacterium]|nr:MAG: pyridoxamine 5'-phosphate oxidase [Acidobacteriota bacterium]RPJ62000.1 MAG: pyridoxamine 5'-phosphate oxidase [Acidobacteriota bacterium]